MLPRYDLKACLYECADKTGLNYISRSLTRKALKIIMYHGVSRDDDPVTCWWQIKQRVFKKQIEYLKKHFTIISLDQAYESFFENKNYPQNTLVLTFDDGYRNFLTHALPVLKEAQIPATIYIPTGPVISRELIWSDLLYYKLYNLDMNLVDLCQIDMHAWPFRPEIARVKAIEAIIKILKGMDNDKRASKLNKILSFVSIDNIPINKDNNTFSILSPNDIEKMSRDSLITIGSHAVSHNPLTTLSHDVVLSELKTSKRFLEQVTGNKISHFCYPAGYYDETIMKFVRDCGYLTAVTPGMTLSVIDSWYEARDNWYKVPRIGIGGYNFRTFFKCQVSGLIDIKGKVNTLSF